MSSLARPYSLPDYYLTSVYVGVKSLPGPYIREAAARIVNPLSYPRYMEYDLTVKLLGRLDGLRVLDIGSPKLPALLIARNSRCELHITDIRGYFIGYTTHFLRKMGSGGRINRDIVLRTQDARTLDYEDESFDRIYAISVVEHIPGNGDSQAMQEMARVLRPGGVAVLTTPFCARGYYEEYIQGDVYEREAAAGGTFYQRHYDRESLQRRLVQGSGLQLQKAIFFGEPTVPFERYWNRVSMRWKLPLLWAQPFLAKAFMKRLRSHQLDAACGVALRLHKPMPDAEARADGPGVG